MLARYRDRSARSFAASIGLILLAGNSGDADLSVAVEQVRSERGLLHLCLTREAGHFPDCSTDPRAIRRSVPANASSVRFEGLPPGAYALSILHDENRNGRLDLFLGIPREGFGFSANPIVRFGPPPFKAAAITLKPGHAAHTVRMRYLL